ncbi:energy transducer TonB [Prevotella sp. P6B4]|uniref:energy transducer TonB n=1 Tax=Prevotella sp. P6B4 TaxID=1410614 RepID=UPI001E3216DC|nr:energy transducer TonB [Prevotella sp. P6B4]
MRRLFLYFSFLITISIHAKDVVKPIMLDNQEGWEWIYTEEHISHNDSYPIKFSYSTFTSHPQYKVVISDDGVIDGSQPYYMVFTRSGELVRVGMPIGNEAKDMYMVTQDIIAKLENHVYIQDYHDNKYGFNKEDDEAHNYVKNELKLPPFDVARPKISAGYSEIGYRYLEQLKEDHKNDFIIPLKCERLNDKSFKLTFGNNILEAIHTYIVTYIGKGTYNYDVTITDVPVENVDKVELIALAKKDQAAKVYDVVEEMPQFPGGSAALFEYLDKSKQYPEAARTNGIQGRVICSFIVEQDGSISDVKVFRGVDPSLDREAQRVILSMPRWISGKQNGEVVRVKYTLPVTFRLQ